ncbi:DapH/DapD/GlmU-related protein [Castellaniella ginsengisoli]|uniref:acyltransferase n=1 Tax=Castellaniella ginsengisoli TaxID=546114 RepID=UPI0034CE1E11
MFILKRIISTRRLWGLFFINIIFQYLLFITSRRVFLLHFTNVVSAEDGFKIVGQESNLIRCLQVNGGILIQASNGVEIDSSCLLGPGVKIISGNHDLDDFSKSSTVSRPIKIGANCWVGANAVILPGVELLPGTIVGAGSVVTSSPGEDRVTIAGNPASIVRKRTIRL